MMKNKSIRIAHMKVGKTVIFDANSFVVTNILSDVFSGNVYERPGTYEDPLKSRKHFWQKTFGSESLPTEQPNAAATFAGSLGQSLDLTSDEMRNMLEQADLD